METIKVVDDKDQEMSVGSRVRIPGECLNLDTEEAHGVITTITDPDADFDDELGRGVVITSVCTRVRLEYPPKVTVKFDDGVEDTFSTFLYRTEGSPENSTYIYLCEDLERSDAEGKPRLGDRAALDMLAEKLNEPGDWNGSDVCEYLAATLERTGRKIEN